MAKSIISEKFYEYLVNCDNIAIYPLHSMCVLTHTSHSLEPQRWGSFLLRIQHFSC